MVTKWQGFDCSRLRVCSQNNGAMIRASKSTMRDHDIWVEVKPVGKSNGPIEALVI